MVTHTEANPSHCVAVSLSDLSFWCFECDSYVKDSAFADMYGALCRAKFPAEAVPEPVAPAAAAAAAPPSLTRSELISGLKSKRFNKVLVVSGAGISRAAGIPDFRSPDGLYATLRTYGVDVPTPTAVFSLDYFKLNPTPFYVLAKQLFYAGGESPQPTIAHRFQRELEQRGMLRRVYTQNIDGLEFKAGMSPESVVQCHGGVESAHCISCHAEVSVEVVSTAMAASSPGDVVVPKCPHCGKTVKPDIVLFGEALPKQFHDMLDVDFHRRSGAAADAEPEADLIIVLGTSLKVQPVSMLPDLFPRHVPRVLVNMKTVGSFDPSRDLFLEGDVQHILGDLMREVGWMDA